MAAQGEEAASSPPPEIVKAMAPPVIMASLLRIHSSSLAPKYSQGGALSGWRVSFFLIRASTLSPQRTKSGLGSSAGVAGQLRSRHGACDLPPMGLGPDRRRPGCAECAARPGRPVPLAQNFRILAGDYFSCCPQAAPPPDRCPEGRIDPGFR
jgi:hypothetical protein